MPDPIADFFDQLGRHQGGYVPSKFRGTIRFDLRRDQRTEHWYLTIENGMVRVSREHSEADTVIDIDTNLFEELIDGRRGVKAALLRGALTIQGDITLLTAFQDLLPGPPGAIDPGVRARARRGSGGAGAMAGVGQAGRSGDTDRDPAREGRTS